MQSCSQPSRCAGVLRDTVVFLVVLVVLTVTGRPAEGAADCTSARCHAQLIDMPVVHEPAAEADCLECHEGGGRNHPQAPGTEFSLTDAVPELCGNCHDLPEANIDLHPPVAEGDCTACHDPHGSANTALLAGDTPATACNECHDQGLPTGEWIHGPVAVGACPLCHQAHGRLSSALLIEPDPTNVCYQCHVEMQAHNEAYAYLHGPVATSCTSCHDAHQSDHRYQLKKAPPDLCLSCHDEIDDLVTEGKVVHGAIRGGRSCLGCHGAHGGALEYNLDQETLELCLSCHDEPLGTGAAALVNMKSLLEANPDWHGPIREGDCAGCHNPHASTAMRLLRFEYPPRFYSIFELDHYQLCFRCHEERNVLEEFSTLTNFRDGQRNLHFLHVNREKGRTCRACHQVHASTHPFHIRDAVPFGAWQLPVNFTPDANGGTCAPGCHKPQTYVR